MIPVKGSLLCLYRIDTVNGREVYHVLAVVQAITVSITRDLAELGYPISVSKRRVAGIIIDDPISFARELSMRLHNDVGAYSVYIERG